MQSRIGNFEDLGLKRASLLIEILGAQGASLLDARGRSVAEATTRLAEKELSLLAGIAANGSILGCCSLHRNEQSLLFSILHCASSGVMINHSTLMQPLKSVNSMVGSGPRVAR